MNDSFGTSLDLSDDGNTLAVGAYAESSASTGINGDATNDLLLASGAAYIFTKNGNTWSQQAYIKADVPRQQNYFGRHLTLSSDGNTLAVASIDNAAPAVNQPTANTANKSGAVYVFKRNGITWTQQQFLKAPVVEENDRFGSSLALTQNGNLLAIGATDEDSSAIGMDGDMNDNAQSNSGAVYLFHRSGSSWTHQHFIKPAEATRASNKFGSAVAFDETGNYLAIGAINETTPTAGANAPQQNELGTGNGAVYLFKNTNGAWQQTQLIKAKQHLAGDNFGNAVALSSSADTLAVGARLEDLDASGFNGTTNPTNKNGSGAVFIY